MALEQYSKLRICPKLLPKKKLKQANLVKPTSHGKWNIQIGSWTLFPLRRKIDKFHYVLIFMISIMHLKDDFPSPLTGLIVDTTTRYEALSFIDGSLCYNQIRIASTYEEITNFCTLKGIYCYIVMHF